MKNQNKILDIIKDLLKDLPLQIVDLQMDNSHINLVLSCPSNMQHKKEFVESYQEQIKELTSAKTVNILLTSHTEHATVSTPTKKPPKKISSPIKNILCVGSGKGGVGKSTLSMHIALGLRELGIKTGLLDADIQGPSIPGLLNMKRFEPDIKDSKLIPPVFNFKNGQNTSQDKQDDLEVPIMSMGMLVQDESPLIWRGPMVSGALEKLLYQTDWKDTEILVIDMPPGTGDISLSLSTKVSDCEMKIVLVTTPQEISLDDVRKTATMFTKLGKPIIGLIENMSTVSCPDCSKDFELFHPSKIDSFIKEFKMPLLAQLPFHNDLSLCNSLLRQSLLGAGLEKIKSAFL